VLYKGGDCGAEALDWLALLSQIFGLAEEKGLRRLDGCVRD
jgi:hypothetical protein